MSKGSEKLLWKNYEAHLDWPWPILKYLKSVIFKKCPLIEKEWPLTKLISTKNVNEDKIDFVMFNKNLKLQQWIESSSLFTNSW